MKKLSKYTSWIVPTCLGLWALFLLIIATPNITGGNEVVFAFLPLILMLAVLLTGASAFVLLFGLSARDPKDDKFTHSPLAKIVAGFIVASLSTSTYAAVTSLNTPILDPNVNRFVFENISVGALFASILLVFVLSAIQKDIYWISRDKSQKLDERQTKERQQVFEKSYKLGTFLVLATVWFFKLSDWEMKNIMAMNFNSVPGHLYIPLINMVIALFALPLVIAAWRNK